MARDIPGSGTDYLDMGNPSVLNITGTALTLAAWIRPDTVDATTRWIAGRRETGSINTDAQYDLSYTNSSIAFSIGDSGGAILSVGSTAPTAGVWTHACGIKNGTGASALYAFTNGVRGAPTSSGGSITSSPYNFLVGRRTSGTGFMDGRVAEVAVWNVALSDAEVLALSKGVSPLKVRPSGLKGYWPLWGVAYPEPDLSGNGSHASQVGSVSAANHAPVGRYT